MKNGQMPIRKPIKIIILCFVLLFSAQFVQAAADDMDNFCSIPPFVATGTKPNLLLMIDNSASMYDLAYQDTSKIYCANAPLTICTANADCISAGTTYCLTSTVTTTTPASFSAKPCTGNANCTAPGSKCKDGYCSKCDTTTGAGDCVGVPATVTVDPKICTTDADCSVTPGDTCNNKSLCTANRQCYDNSSYDAAGTYGGYFQSTSRYYYDFTNNKFSSGAGLPVTCDYSAGTYLCVNTSMTGTVEEVDKNPTGFVATGNFLNWLTTSKFDIEKMILTGGKYDATTDPSNPGLIAESRGCAGRKFLKSVPGVALTFAIRGGVGIGSTVSQATEYGQTYVEIFTGTYNEEECLLAAAYWSDITNAKLGPFQNATKGCVGAGSSALSATNVWNHILHNCYQGMKGGAQGYSTNLGPLEKECVDLYAHILPADMTDKDAPYAVCSSVLSYVDSSGSSQVGYLGACWNGTDFSGPCAPNPALNDLTQMENYCLANVNTNPVVDPSSTVMPGLGTSAPGWVMEQGLNNTPLAGTLKVKIGLATPPTGLIDKYKESILFGAMTLNNNGSRTECSSSGSVPCYKACESTITRTCLVDTDCPGVEHCVSLPATDGGQVISGIGGTCSVAGTFCTDDSNCPFGETCTISIGNHDSGLINKIDSIVANTWTSVAEGFYSAIGYFAQDPSIASQSKDFRLQTGTCSVTTSLTCNPADMFPCPVSETCQTGNTKGDYDITKNPSNAWCRSNNILIITDGMSTADQNSRPTNLVASNGNNYPVPYSNSSNYGNCPTYKGSSNLAGLTWIAKNKKINDSAFTSSMISAVTPTLKNQSINTYVVYTGPITSTGTGLCDTYTLMQTAATNGGTSLYTAASTSQLFAALNDALGGIAAKAASGSAVSVLTTSARGVGSMLQAYFFPTTKLGSGKDISWLGYTQNIWIDPSDNLRDDYSLGSPDAHLLLAQDRVMMLNVDPASNATKVGLFDTLADGSGGSLASCSTTTVLDFSQIVPLWEGGNELAQVTATDNGTERNIFTAIPGGTGMGTAGGITFDRSTVTGDATLSAALNPDSTFTVDNIVRYTRGVAIETALISGASYTNFRDRTLDNGDVWKLGDVINSTPKVVGNIPQNTYFIDYGDSTYYKFISSDDFRHRSSIAIIGANDGMLHAFRVGYLKDKTDNNFALGTDVKALFRDSYGAPDTAYSHLGEEVWAYIPYNVLPYLKYYASHKYPGCHIYGVDLTVRSIDVSIGDGSAGAATATKATDGSSWRTILIGGMRFGGACSAGTTPTGPPIAGVGFSSYFALDVTDYLTATGNFIPPSAVTPLPTPLWEFTDTDLGYTTSAPTVIRTGSTSINGHWYVLFGSGPTQLPTSNPNRDIDRNRQGYIYILNLADGTLVKKIPLNHNAVVSDILAIDAEKDYQSEKLYFGTAYDNAGTWAGKLMKITLPSNFKVDDICGVGSGTLPTYAQCTVSSLTTLFSGNFPFTASPDAAKDDLGNTWVYAGSGKYNSSIDEYDSSPQAFLGLIDNAALPKTASGSSSTACPASCSDLYALCNVSNCTTTATVPGLGGTTDICTFNGQTSSFQTIVTAVTNATSNAPPNKAGWIIYLPDSKERVISRPLAVGGVVDFLSYVPSSSVCTKGGDSYLYAVDYKTGGPPTNVAIRAVGATSATSGDIDIYRRVKLGPGAPPTGEAIIITPPKEGQEKLKKKIQVSTGVIVETENKPTISTISRIINWLKK